MFSSMAISRCAAISASRSASRGGFETKNACGPDARRSALIEFSFGGHGEDADHHVRQSLPVGGVFLKLLAAAAGDGVELGLAIVVGGAPFGVDPSALLEADEGGVDGALVEQDLVSAGLLNAAGNAVAVLSAHGGEGLQDHQVQGTLQEIEFGLAQFSGSCVDAT